MSISREFSVMISDTARRLGVNLDVGMADVDVYVADQIQQLRKAAIEPGYALVLRAAGLNVAAFAAGRGVDVADAADAELVGLITGALGIGARALLV